MSVRQLHCENCQRIRWHTRWEPSSRVVANLELFLGLTLGISLLVLRYLRFIERRSAWRCKVCFDAPPAPKFDKTSHEQPYPYVKPCPPVTRVVAEPPDVDLESLSDARRLAILLRQKPINCTQREYWAWHNKLYLGGSWNSPEWQARAREAKERDGYRCIRCGGMEELQTDHIHPLSKGGNNEYVNLQTLCKQCHENKTGRPLKSWGHS